MVLLVVPNGAKVVNSAGLQFNRLICFQADFIVRRRRKFDGGHHGLALIDEYFDRRSVLKYSQSRRRGGCWRGRKLFAGKAFMEVDSSRFRPVQLIAL